jgi:hypothetical protein
MLQETKLLRYQHGVLAYYVEQTAIVKAQVLLALSWLAEGLAEQGWKGVKQPSELVDHVLADMELMMVGDTLVAFTIVEPWFMQGQMVAEEFVAPLTRNPAPIELVVEALQAVGAATGCTHLSIGTRANPRQKGLARLIEQSGCQLSSIELVKEIP